MAQKTSRRRQALNARAAPRIVKCKQWAGKEGAGMIRRDAPYVAGETAILLVDLQRVWLEPGLDPHHPERRADHPFYWETRERTIPNNERLLKAARSAGIEVLHTIIRSLTKDGRDRSLDHKLTPIHVPPDAPEALPPAALAPAGDEILLPKTSSGVFNSTNIDYVLKNLGIRQLIVTGIMTDQCVDMAVRDAADRGYLVTCVSDACAAATRERHDGALKAFGGYCWIADTDTVVARLEAIAPARTAAE
jgi:nicotinamidase-related amidase